MRYWMFVAVIGVLISGCSALDQITLGTGQPTFLDPTKIYLKSHSFSVSRNDDLDRYVCMTGPLQCRAWGMQWECVCR